MRKAGMFSIAILLMAGVAVADDVIQSEENVKEKTLHSTTVQENANQIGEKRHNSNSTTVEKQRQTTLDDMDGNTTTQDKVKVEKKHSQTTTSDGSDESIPGSMQEYHHQSETYHQHSTEVEKK